MNCLEGRPRNLDLGRAIGIRPPDIEAALLASGEPEWVAGEPPLMLLRILFAISLLSEMVHEALADASADWMARPMAELGDLTPTDAIRRGLVHKVCAVAAIHFGYAEEFRTTMPECPRG